MSCRARAGCFDGTSPETGPLLILSGAGIVVLYNGKNATEDGDPELGTNACVAGEALFDPMDPAPGRTGGPVRSWTRGALREDPSIQRRNNYRRVVGLLPWPMVPFPWLRQLVGGRCHGFEK